MAHYPRMLVQQFSDSAKLPMRRAEDGDDRSFLIREIAAPVVVVVSQKADAWRGAAVTFDKFVIFRGTSAHHAVGEFCDVAFARNILVEFVAQAIRPRRDLAREKEWLTSKIF